MKRVCVVIAGLMLVFVLGTTSATADCDLCGDVDGNGFVNVSDAVALVNWFTPPFIEPPCPNCGNVNCDHAPNWDDVTYIIDYIFGGGPPPCDTDNDGNPDCGCQ